MHAPQGDELIVKAFGITTPQVGHSPNPQVREVGSETWPNARNALKFFQRGRGNGRAGDGRHTVWNYSIRFAADPASRKSRLPQELRFIGKSRTSADEAQDPIAGAEVLYAYTRL